MRSSLARTAILALLTLVAARPAASQWHVAGGLRAPRFSGGAVEPATGRSLEPYRPTMWEVGVEHRGGRVGVGLRFRYAPTGLALEGDEAVAVVKDALTVYGIDPEVSLRVATLGSGSILRLMGGPVVDIWKLPDIGSHVRLGAAGALGLDIPLGGRLSATARVGTAVTPSPFDARDLEVGLERRTLWRREASAVLRYRL